MTTRYGQKAYGKEVYSGPDTYVFAATVDTNFASTPGVDANFVLDAVVPSVYEIDSFIQFIGPITATSYIELGVEGSLDKLTGVEATINSVFGVVAVLERSVGLFAEVILDIELSSDLYIGDFWNKEYPSGAWATAPAPPPIDWTPEVIPTVEWRN